MRPSAALAALALLLLPVTGTAEQAAPAYNPMAPPGGGPSAVVPEGSAELGGLPPGPGAEETYYLCSACHSIAIIKQQEISDARWDDLWSWMIEEQGMPEQDAATKETILGYLKTHFSSQR